MAHLNKKPYESTPQPTFNHIHIQPRYFPPPFKPTTSQYQPSILGKPQPRQPQPQWKPHFQSRIKSLNAKFVVNLDTLHLFAFIAQI